MDRPIKNPVPIRSESDKINGYGYGFRLIRSEPDPLTELLPEVLQNFGRNEDIIRFE